MNILTMTSAKAKEETLDILKEYLQTRQQDFYRLAYSYTKNPDAAMDVVQEAVVRAIAKANSLKNPEYMKTWFYRILVNESLTYLRKNRTLSLDDGYSEEIPAQDRDVARSMDLYNAIEQLDTRLKTVVILRFFEDMKLEDIAKITQSNLSTTKSRLYKGLALLKTYLDE